MCFMTYKLRIFTYVECISFQGTNMPLIYCRLFHCFWRLKEEMEIKKALEEEERQAKNNKDKEAENK